MDFVVKRGDALNDWNIWIIDWRKTDAQSNEQKCVKTCLHNMYAIATRMSVVQHISGSTRYTRIVYKNEINHIER